MRAHGGIRHVEAASHMADGYSRAAPGNIGVCLGTSGPAGTDMITGLYAVQADSIPILCVTGQAPRARLHAVTEFEEILCLDPSLTIDDVSGSVLQTGVGRAAPPTGKA
jgi:tartronate-semialdehyde synthase